MTLIHIIPFLVMAVCLLDHYMFDERFSDADESIIPKHICQ